VSRNATRATAALLCGVVLVALGLMVAGMPASESPPESLHVALDFDTFVPGETQTRTSQVEIPVPSRVTDAAVTQTGDDATIDVRLTICQAELDRCEPLRAGLELSSGPHALTVEATLTARIGTERPHDRTTDTLPARPPSAALTPPAVTTVRDTATASGEHASLVGQIRIVESTTSSIVDANLLLTIAGGGLLAIAVGAMVIRPRRTIAGIAT
jgi:hypothetical protein